MVSLNKKELSIFGSRNNLNQFQKAMYYAYNNSVAVINMISDIYPFDLAIEAFKKANSNSKEFCKILIEM